MMMHVAQGGLCFGHCAQVWNRPWHCAACADGQPYGAGLLRHSKMYKCWQSCICYNQQLMSCGICGWSTKYYGHMPCAANNALLRLPTHMCCRRTCNCLSSGCIQASACLVYALCAPKSAPSWLPGNDNKQVSARAVDSTMMDAHTALWIAACCSCAFATCAAFKHELRHNALQGSPLQLSRVSVAADKQHTRTDISGVHHKRMSHHIHFDNHTEFVLLLAIRAAAFHFIGMCMSCQGGHGCGAIKVQVRWARTRQTH
jgi:hypothetical protein